MASSSETPRTFHVFISFRGPDVRNTFLSHLYEALVQRGIHAYIDEEKLEKGECISPALMKAINESRIVVVIFSENYAASHWCLEELAEIMECKERNYLIVLPVFYKVEPSEVRGRRKSYGDAMAKHECRFGKDSEKLKKWKEALDNAGSLSGWDLKNDGNEAKLVEDIIKKISDRLNPTPLHVTKYPVGLNSQVEKLKSMLSMRSEDDVCMVGLWGPGGVGKTTLAKAIYNDIFTIFGGSSFIASVREKANDLVSLQNQLLSQILRDKTLTIFSVHEGIALMKDRLRSKKVLVVLDDVDNLEQLNMLAGACDWFGKGSLIIVTTRNNHLLTSHGINDVHEVKPLNGNEARELFCWHCFRRSQSKEIREDLIQSTLRYASGFPLALEVLGAFLCGRNEIEWESALTKLANSPEQSINQVLRVSYDALDCNEKEIFLDIACFFKGCKATYVKKVLDSCGFCSNIGVKILIERALISVEGKALQMHDLVQLMGRDIVNQDDLNRRSRLWLYDDVLSVLSKNKGTNSIKAIRLKLSSPKEITIHRDAFANMEGLRLLILLNVHVSFHAPIYLPSELRWLKWPKYSTPAIKFSLGRNKLVGLDISNNYIRGLGVLTKQLKNLKVLNCSRCKYLVNIPDLSGIPNLENLNLSGCKNLVRVHQSVGFLSKLKTLSLKGCSKLTRFLKVLKTKSLIKLSLSGCSRLKRFPEIPEQMDCWDELHLRGTSIKEVPASIENGISLRTIDLSWCINLTTLPSSVYNLNRLSRFILRNCCNLTHFPKNTDDSAEPPGRSGFGALYELDLTNCNISEVDFLENLSCFTRLEYLDLSGNKISSLPSSINKRDRLCNLWVEDCDRLLEIPKLPSIITMVIASNCKSLCRVPKLPTQNDLVVNFSSCPLPLNVSDICPLERISNQTRRLRMIVSGDEMPSWMVPVDARRFSFSNPHLSPNKCVGLALCVVLFAKKENADLCVAVRNTRCKDIFAMISPAEYLMGRMRSDCVWFTFTRSDEKNGLFWSGELFPGGVDEADREYCVEISLSTGIILKKWGWRLIWKDGGDDLNTIVHYDVPERATYFTERALIESDDFIEGDESDELEGNDLDEEDCWVSYEDNGGNDCRFKWAQLLRKGCLAVVRRLRRAKSSLRRRLC